MKLSPLAWFIVTAVGVTALGGGIYAAASSGADGSQPQATVSATPDASGDDSDPDSSAPADGERPATPPEGGGDRHDGKLPPGEDSDHGARSDDGSGRDDSCDDDPSSPDDSSPDDSDDA